MGVRFRFGFLIRSNGGIRTCSTQRSARVEHARAWASAPLSGRGVGWPSLARVRTGEALRYSETESAEQPRALARIRALENTVGLAMACQRGEDGAYTKFGYFCIVSPSGRVLAGIEAGEGFVVHELSMAKVSEWRKTATYLEDRKDHEERYRRLLLT